MQASLVTAVVALVVAITLEVVVAAWGWPRSAARVQIHWAPVQFAGKPVGFALLPAATVLVWAVTTAIVHSRTRAPAVNIWICGLLLLGQIVVVGVAVSRGPSFGDPTQNAMGEEPFQA